MIKFKKKSVWIKDAAAWVDVQGEKIALYSDKMSEVAFTEGENVEAQTEFSLLL